ncbi:MAG TPA: tetratricopeptide repeat protein, partial [Verrucomicrobiae bacterium]|nr:tetratricopeptide repeat protein [Verrucomicrobiae bacterium]
MPRTSDFIRLALVTTLALSWGPGCTKAAKKERYQTQAENDFKAGSYDKAKIEYLNVLRFDPQNATAFRRLGQMWLEEGAPLKAGAFLVKASELEPNDLENRVRLARTYQAVGRHDQAKAEVLFVLQHSPDDEEALLFLSEIALKPEEIASAEQALQKSTKE